MASSTIAGAHGAGKSAAARSVILRDAHSHARQIMLQDAKRRAGGQLWPFYRAAFAYALRLAWGAAKELARQAISTAALSALEEIEDADPTNYGARIDALHVYAATLPPTSDGRRKIMADADDLAMAARLIPFTAMEPAYHAH